MDKKEKAKWEVTLKNILYYIDSPEEQEKMITILQKYNDQLPDGKIKDLIQKSILKAKKNYYDKVDFLVDDILNGRVLKDSIEEQKRKEVLSKLLEEIKPMIEQAEKTFWEKLCNLFKWS